MTEKAAYLFMFAVSLDPFPVFFHLLLLCGSVGKESAYNAGDPGSIPGSGRSTGKGIGYRLQDSWASLVAQLVKNLLAMGEAWVQSLGRDDPLEKEMAAHSSNCLEIPCTEEPGGLQSMESQESNRTSRLKYNEAQSMNKHPLTH